MTDPHGPAPGLPGYGSGPPGPAQPPAWVFERPVAIESAIWLMRAGAALSIVAGVIGLLLYNPDNSAAGSLEYGRSSPGEEQFADAVATIGSLLGIAVTVSLWLWMAWANGKGRPWARIVATILAAISAASFVISSVVAFMAVDLANGSQAAGVIGFIFSIFSQIVGLMALWQLYRPESSRFYDASERLRRMPPYPYGYASPYSYGYQYPYGYQPQPPPRPPGYQQSPPPGGPAPGSTPGP
jgi:hypothetical protein